MNMKKISLALILGATIGTSAFAAPSSDLVVTQLAAGSTTSFEFDFLNDASATALQFELKLGQGVKIETGNCIAGLPTSHTGACNASNGVLKVAIFSPTNAPLTSGSIGSVTVSGFDVSKRAEVSGLLVGNADGQPVTSNAILDGGASLKENFEK